MSVADTDPADAPSAERLRSIALEIKRKGRDIGFDLVGIASVSPSKYRDYYRAWLDDGQAGTMEYLHRRFDERTDPAVYMPGAKSVICVALNYFVPLEPAQPGGGRIARYALGDDYHEHMKAKLHALADTMRELAPGIETRCSVDTAPLMEKELAARAGIGWIGKNTCVINPAAGSWLLLGEIITTLDLPADAPAVDRCGTCRRCIDACPTNAFTDEYKLDARKCISYLTIEHRGGIEPALQRQIGDWLFGCDVCQNVCPWNSKAASALLPELQPRFPSGSIDVAHIADWSADEYRQALRHSAIKRVKLPILQRNAAIVSDNLSKQGA